MEGDMCTSTFVKRHIYNLPAGKIFSTGDLLKYGKRSNIDRIIHNLVREERIFRVARGLFVKHGANTKMPTFAEIAEAKAAALGHFSFSAGENLNGSTGHALSQASLTCGGKSSFRAGNKRIQFHVWRIAQDKTSGT